jgi:hypothetical protein
MSTLATSDTTGVSFGEGERDRSFQANTKQN